MIFKREETIKNFDPKVVVEDGQYKKKNFYFDIVTAFGAEQEYYYMYYSIFFKEFI